MRSTATVKQNSTTSPKHRKQQKHAEEREEKHRIDAVSGKIDVQQLIEIAFIGETKRYPRLGRESIINYAEQTMDMHISNEAAFNFAEDLSYKLRQIIHAAKIRAHMSGRTSVMGCDIDDSLKTLSLEKVYGASNHYNFIPLAKKNVFYLDDSLVNLKELANEDLTLVQPASIEMTTKSYPEITQSSKNYVKYFDTMCRTLICNTPKLQQESLRDIRRNPRIAPIANWFYHFGYFLLAKDVTYDSLTHSALALIRALEENVIAVQFVDEIELKFLASLLLQRLFKPQPNVEVMHPTCSILALLCCRIPLRELVAAKIHQKLSDCQQHYALGLLSIVNQLGGDEFSTLIETKLDYFFRLLEDTNDPNLRLALLSTYRLFRKHNVNLKPETVEILWKFYNVFGYVLNAMRSHCCHCQEERLESNWLNIKIALWKSRREIRVKDCGIRQAKLMAHDVFNVSSRKETNYRIRTVIHSLEPKPKVIVKRDFGLRQSSGVTVGRRSLCYHQSRVKTCLYSLSMII